MRKGPLVQTGNGSPSRLARAAGVLIGRLHARCAASWRIQAKYHDGRLIRREELEFGPKIYALCERDALAMAGLLSCGSFCVLIAPGRDGDWAASAAESLGSRAVRGATGRRGRAALRELIDRLRESPDPAAIVVDGPLGPAGSVRPGTILCALETGRPIVPVAAAARPKLVFPGTWSGIYQPLPLARVVFGVAEALRPDSREDLESAARELARRLEEARRLAGSVLAGPRPIFLDVPARRVPEA